MKINIIAPVKKTDVSESQSTICHTLPHKKEKILSFIFTIVDFKNDKQMRQTKNESVYVFHFCVV